VGGQSSVNTIRFLSLRSSVKGKSRSQVQQMLLAHESHNIQEPHSIAPRYAKHVSCQLLHACLDDCTAQPKTIKITIVIWVDQHWLALLLALRLNHHAGIHQLCLDWYMNVQPVQLCLDRYMNVQPVVCTHSDGVCHEAQIN
jgi:hypothetical protein